MNNSILGYVAAFLVLSNLSANPASAQTETQTVQTYTHNYNPGMTDNATVLDSWMAPVVVRKREVTRENGDTESVVEPMVMERHERVIAPVEDTTTVTSRAYSGRTVRTTEQSDVSTRVSRTVPRRHLVAHAVRHRRAIASTGASRSRYVARRTVTELRPAVTETTEQTEHKSMIIERRDPALLIY